MSATSLVEIDATEAIKRLGIRKPVKFKVLSREAADEQGIPVQLCGSSHYYGDHHAIRLFLGCQCTCGQCGDMDPNETMLHELVHASQAERSGLDERGWHTLGRLSETLFGYYASPHEIEAREVSRELEQQGVRVIR